MKGLFRGSAAVVPRAFIASTSQLTSFNYTKEWLNELATFKSHPFLVSFLGSMIGGIVISVMVTPFDLVLMRLYNQGNNSISLSKHIFKCILCSGIDVNGKGVLYKSYFDCVGKIYKTEGIYAFYKGLGPMYFRLGPHTVLCLTFWDKFKEIYSQYENLI